MQYENLNRQTVEIKHDKNSLLNAGTPREINLAKKACKHRNENGWCSKSGRQCPLLNLIFINQ